MSEELVMPKEFYGKTHKRKPQDVYNPPREWTNKEIEWCLEKKNEGYSISQISKAIGRTYSSVSIKLKRISKKENKYNINHRDEKYEFNKKFIDLINPESVLDVYCGVMNYYRNKTDIRTISNDIDESIDADYNMDALKFLCHMYVKDMEFDLVDLDPFGSAFDCFDLAIKMANKGIIITFGEMGHIRFKRLDFVSRYYGIENLDEFTIDNMIKVVQKIGIRNKKKLTPIFNMRAKHINRVYFKIDECRVDTYKK